MLAHPAAVLAKGSGGPWEQHIESARNALAYGDFQKAEDDLKLAMEDSRKFKDNDIRLGETFAQMGELNARLQNYTLSKQYFERALNVQQKLLGAESAEAANSLYGIALCCQQMGDHLAAEIFLKRVDEIWRKRGMKDNLISILPSMGTYASMKGNLPQAESYYKQLVDLESTQGGTNPRYGDHLNLLATTLGAEGKYGEAKDYATRAVAYLKKNSDSSIALDAAQDNLRIVERQATGKIVGDAGSEVKGIDGKGTDESTIAMIPNIPVPKQPVVAVPSTPVNPVSKDPGSVKSTPANPVSKDPGSVKSTPANPVSKDPGSVKSTPANPVSKDPGSVKSTPANPVSKDPGSVKQTPANPVSKDPSTVKQTPANPLPKDPPVTPQVAVKTSSATPLNLTEGKDRGLTPEQVASIGGIKPEGFLQSLSSKSSDNNTKPWHTDLNFKRKDNKSFGKVSYLSEGRLITPEEYKALLLATEAYEMMRQEKYRMAADVLKQALDIFPELPSAHTNLGLALARLGQNDEAIDHLKTSIALDPTRSAPWVNLASSFQTGGRLKDCVLTYKEYLKRFPQDSLVAKATELVKHLQEEVSEQEEVEKSMAVVHDAGKSDYFAYTTAGGTYKWSSSHSPLKVYIGSGIKAQGYKTEYQGIMTDAFNNWAIASQDKLKFDFVAKPEGADIACVWTNDYSQVSSPAEGGEAQVHSTQEGIDHVKIVILTADPTPDSPLNQNQVRAVCLHEIGHSLGLLGHSPQPSDIMFCTMPAADSKIAISPRDVDTIRKLYSPEVQVAMKTAKPGASVLTNSGVASDPNAAVQEGAQLVATHAYAQAIEKLEAVLKVDPSNVVARENLSKAYNDYALDLDSKGKAQEAESLLKKAMGLRANLKNAALKLMTLSNYASILRKHRKEKEAEQIEAEAKSEK